MSSMNQKIKFLNAKNACGAIASVCFVMFGSLWLIGWSTLHGNGLGVMLNSETPQPNTTTAFEKVQSYSLQQCKSLGVIEFNECVFSIMTSCVVMMAVSVGLFLGAYAKHQSYRRYLMLPFMAMIFFSVLFSAYESAMSLWLVMRSWHSDNRLQNIIVSAIALCHMTILMFINNIVHDRFKHLGQPEMEEVEHLMGEFQLEEGQNVANQNFAVFDQAHLRGKTLSVN